MLFLQRYSKSTSEDMEEEIDAKLQTMTKQAQTLHLLTKKRKERVAMIKEKKNVIESTITSEVNQRREVESKRRIKNNGEVEQKLQKVTSALMLELLQICEEVDVPRYILSIAKILDNYQGGINTIRSNSNWLSELISQLTDQMRNFDAAQKKMEAKFDLLFEKVLYLSYLITKITLTN